MINDYDEEMEIVMKYFDSIVRKQSALIWDRIWSETTYTLFMPLNDTWNSEVSRLYETMILETELFRMGKW